MKMREGVKRSSFYTSADSVLCFRLSVIDGKLEKVSAIKFYVKFGKSVIEIVEMLSESIL
jgi:hypothetical protein